MLIEQIGGEMNKWEREEQRARDVERMRAIKAAARKANRTQRSVTVIHGPRGYYLGTGRVTGGIVIHPDSNGE